MLLVSVCVAIVGQAFVDIGNPMEVVVGIGAEDDADGVDASVVGVAVEALVLIGGAGHMADFLGVHSMKWVEEGGRARLHLNKVEGIVLESNDVNLAASLQPPVHVENAVALAHQVVGGYLLTGRTQFLVRHRLSSFSKPKFSVRCLSQKTKLPALNEEGAGSVVGVISQS